MKKSIIIILALIMMFQMSAFAESIESSAGAVYSGKCGDDVTWTLDYDAGTLDFTGTGAIYDYNIDVASYSCDTPWYQYRNKLIRVTFSEGITYIGNAVVYNCKNVKRVYLPSTVTEIGIDCFTSCSGLAAVHIPSLETWM
ncbi:MAG: leucine-rich repeat protein, partial [Clostridia bacterium]|nr:leucine-rich repeat protein [Clostridia bacterium]